MTALVLVEHDNVALGGATLNAVTAALRCCDEVHLLVVGHQCEAVAKAVARIAGVAKVLFAEAPHLAEGLAENLAAQVIAIAGNYSHILAAATAAGKNTLPRVAAKLDVAQISDITKVIGTDIFERPVYAGNAIATVQSADPIKVATVRPTGFEPAEMCGGDAPVEVIEAVGDFGRSRFVAAEKTRSDRPELLAAAVVVSGGRGIGSAENYRRLLEPLADKLGAGLGASRAAVDAGFAPNDYQVGQTGKIIAPQLYIAVGISGAIQHLAGMKDSKVIVAINKDADAPIFQIADYGLVADLNEIVPQFAASL